MERLSTCPGNCRFHLHSAAGFYWLIRRFPYFHRSLTVSYIAHLLREMKSFTERLHRSPVQSVIAVLPATIANTHHSALLNAAAGVAGLNIHFDVRRSVLAASPYVSRNPARRTLLVFELGYPIDEISLLADDGCGTLNVIAAVGDLGCPLFNYVASNIARRPGRDISGDATALTILQLSCEQAKDWICFGRPNATVRSWNMGRELVFPIDRDWLVELNVRHIRDGIMRCLTEAGVEQNAVDEIVLAGAYANLPEVRGVLAELFEGKPVRCDIDPAHIVRWAGSHYVAARSASLNAPLFPFFIENCEYFPV